jgi:hypothetical protein
MSFLLPQELQNLWQACFQRWLASLLASLFESRCENTQTFPRPLLIYFISGNVSLVDLTLNLAEPTSLLEILDALEAASHTSLQGVLHVEHDQLVSCDFQGNAHSAVIDAKACVELNPKVSIYVLTLMYDTDRFIQFFKILAWFDNDWAYSSRLLDMLAFMSKLDSLSIGSKIC